MSFARWLLKKASIMWKWILGQQFFFIFYCKSFSQWYFIEFRDADFKSATSFFLQTLDLFLFSGFSFFCKILNFGKRTIFNKWFLLGFQKPVDQCYERRNNSHLILTIHAFAYQSTHSDLGQVMKYWVNFFSGGTNSIVFEAKEVAKEVGIPIYNDPSCSRRPVTFSVTLKSTPGGPKIGEYGCAEVSITCIEFGNWIIRNHTLWMY